MTLPRRKTNITTDMFSRMSPKRAQTKLTDEIKLLSTLIPYSLEITAYYDFSGVEIMQPVRNYIRN